LPASPGYLVATLSGSQAACAEPAVPRPTVAATTAASNAPVQYLMPGLPSSRKAVHCTWRALGARARPPAQQVTPAPGLARELAVPGHHLAARQRQDRPAPQGEAVERVVAGARVEPALVDPAGRGGIEQDHVGVAADRDGALLRVEPEDAGGVRGERGHERLQRDPPLAHALRVDHRHLGLEPGHPVGHAGEVVRPRRLLLDGPRGVVAADGLDVAGAQPLPE